MSEAPAPPTKSLAALTLVEGLYPYRAVLAEVYALVTGGSACGYVAMACELQRISTDKRHPQQSAAAVFMACLPWMTGEAQWPKQKPK